MAWKKSSEGLKAIFNTALPADPRVKRRQMFGYPSALVNGHLFTGLHEERMVVRLDEAERNELLGLEGACIFEPVRVDRCVSTLSCPRRSSATSVRCVDGRLVRSHT